MRNIAGLTIRDLLGLRRVCGFATALRWLTRIVTNLGPCIRGRSLRAADRAMGDGPFRARRGGASARLFGNVFSGMREIWVRDVYLRGDFLVIAPDARVVDLGSNRGVFTALALAHGPSVRVVSVEPSSLLNDELRRNIDENGWLDRVTLVRAFLGGNTQKQEDFMTLAEYADAPWLSPGELMERCGFAEIDFLKCDIEGSEFEFLAPDSPLLAAARQIAVEVHDFAGDRHAFIRRLESAGFQVGPVRHERNDCIVLARRVDA